MALSHSPSIITNGLVLYLDAANRRSYPGSGTTWFDLSGNGNNGTLTNGPTFNSANGGGINIDQTNDYVTLPSNTNITDYYKNNTSFTFDGFIKKSSIINTAEGYNLGFSIFSNNDGGWIPGWSLYIRNVSTGINNIVFQIGYNSVSDTVRHTSSYGLIDDIWTHIAVSHSVSNPNSICNFYKNGILINSLISTNAINFSGSISNNSLIGRHPSFLYQGHNSQGQISSYKIYNRVLSPIEIAQNFNATRGRFGI